MSAALAARPAETAERAPRSAPRRHLDIAPSRAQRRARPRLAVAAAAMLGIVVILLGQLGLSIAVADGAYTISALQVEQRELSRQEEALSEQLESLQSPQFLALNAESLGMVASGSLPYIDLATGAILGKSTKAGGRILQGESAISNMTLAGRGIVNPQEQELELGYAGGSVISTGEGDASSDDASSTGLVLDPGIHVVGAPSTGVAAGSDSPAPVSSGPTSIPSPKLG